LSPNEDDLDPPPGDEVVEEEDIDLDLGDLAGPKNEPVIERLKRAAERGSTRSQPHGWRDTPVNVTPSGRHEIIEEEGDLPDESVELGEAARAITSSGRHEIVDEDDLDDDLLNDAAPEVGPRVTQSGRHEVIDEDDDSVDHRSYGLGDSDDLDESSLVAATGSAMVEESEFDPNRPDIETTIEGTATIAETRIDPATMHKVSRDTERGITRDKLNRRDTETVDDPADDSTEQPPDETDVGRAHETPVPPAMPVRDTERSPAVPQSDASDDSELPESDTAQETAPQADPVEGLAQIPSGASDDSLLDNPQSVREEPFATRSDAATQDEHELSATLEKSAGPAGQGDAQPETNEKVVSAGATQDSSADREVPDSGHTADVGAAANKEADKEALENSAIVGGSQIGTVPPERPHAEPSEVHSQRPEGFTVADDSGAPLGRGLDVGTANLVASRMDEEGGIEFFPARNAFLDVPEDPYTLKMLKGQGVPYIKRENRLYVIGEDAFELANIFNREMRRPMKNGLISPTDVDAMPMEVELFKKILGPPRAEGEMVYYSIPADPVDSTLNIVYHTNIANGLLERLGYRGTPFNEGQAIVFSELGDEDFTGIGISCGGGMVNVCVAFRSMNVISFSSAKGGDWIDQQAAQVMGCAASKITAIKERGVDINAPKSPEEEAIVIYYRHLIKYSLDNIVKKFAITKDIPNFPKPVAIAISGGTSKVGGFVDVFKDEFSKMASKFPIKISDIRRAEDQLNATAKGCLLAALSHED